MPKTVNPEAAAKRNYVPFSLSVPKKDRALCDFLNNQQNKSNSVRLAFKMLIAHYGTDTDLSVLAVNDFLEHAQISDEYRERYMNMSAENKAKFVDLVTDFILKLDIPDDSSDKTSKKRTAPKKNDKINKATELNEDVDKDESMEVKDSVDIKKDETAIMDQPEQSEADDGMTDNVMTDDNVAEPIDNKSEQIADEYDEKDTDSKETDENAENKDADSDNTDEETENVEDIVLSDDDVKMESQKAAEDSLNKIKKESNNARSQYNDKQRTVTVVNPDEFML